MTCITTAMAMPRRIGTDVEGFLAFLAERHPDQYEALVALGGSGTCADLNLDLADLLSNPTNPERCRQIWLSRRATGWPALRQTTKPPPDVSQRRHCAVPGQCLGAKARSNRSAVTGLTISLRRM